MGYYYLVTVPSGDYSIEMYSFWTERLGASTSLYSDEPTSNSVDAMAMIPQANKPSVEFKASNPQAGRDYLPHNVVCQQDGDIVWMYPPKEELIVRVTRLHRLWDS